MAPVVEIRGVQSTELAGVAHIVRLSDIRRLGAWNRVGARTSSRGAAAIARRHAMRTAVARVSSSQSHVVAAAEAAVPDVVSPATAVCARPVRMRPGAFDAAELRVLCAAA